MRRLGNACFGIVAHRRRTKSTTYRENSTLFREGTKDLSVDEEICFKECEPEEAKSVSDLSLRFIQKKKKTFMYRLDIFNKIYSSRLSQQKRSTMLANKENNSLE